MFWSLIVTSHLALAETPLKASFDRYNKYAVQPLTHIEQDHFEKLEKGEVVVTIDNSDRGWRATGLILIDAPLNLIWVSTRDECRKQQKSTYEVILKSYGKGSQDWYGLIDLPWPLDNRHWIIQTKPNYKMAQITRNKSWERTWNLVENAELIIKEAQEKGSFPDHSKGAIFTPVNAGAWFMTAVDSKQTILGYQVTTSVGGVIPDKMMMQFVGTTLDEMLMEMKKRVGTIEDHYQSPHAILFGGDGRPISHFD